MSRSLWRISKTRAIILVTSSEVHTKGQCIKDSRILSRADYIAKRQIDVKVTQTMLAVLFIGTLFSTCCLENQVINQWILSFPSSARSANCPPLTNVMDRPVHQNRRHLWQCRAPVCPAPGSSHCEVTLFLKACGVPSSGNVIMISCVFLCSVWNLEVPAIMSCAARESFLFAFCRRTCIFQHLATLVHCTLIEDQWVWFWFTKTNSSQLVTHHTCQAICMYAIAGVVNRHQGNICRFNGVATCQYLETSWKKSHQKKSELLLCHTLSYYG